MKKLLLFFIVLLGFTACEDLADEINNALSSFDANVTGDVTSNFTGDANFVHVIIESQTPQSSGIVVDLTNDADESEALIIGVTVNNAEGVKPGTYTFDVDETDFFITATYNTQAAGYIFPVEGKTTQIILTSVEGTKAKGSFTLNVANVLGDEVEVTGSFDAIGITQTN